MNELINMSLIRGDQHDYNNKSGRGYHDNESEVGIADSK